MNRNTTKKLLFACLLLMMVLTPLYIFRHRIAFLLRPPVTGTAIDSLNGVKVYYNGDIGNVKGRNISPDGYNIGLQFQCVEFVKRYYYEFYHHKMPDSYGHAVSFYDTTLQDSSYNARRDLMQYSNPGYCMPKVGDLIVFAGNGGNPYGHVAIISKVKPDKIEIVQQNPGIGMPSRVTIPLSRNNDIWRINSDRILGWLRMK